MRNAGHPKVTRASRVQPVTETTAASRSARASAFDSCPLVLVDQTRSRRCASVTTFRSRDSMSVSENSPDSG